MGEEDDGFAGNIDEALETQHVMLGNHALQRIDEGCRIGDRAKFDDEAVEFVVVVRRAVLMLQLVMGFAVDDIVFRADSEAKQDGGRHIAVLRFDDRRLAAGA